ncbi:D-amino-acid:oxygen oxidoreductase (deaminating) [Isoptericola sp. CG 20/1183]|uniref:D-amino-acid oxidase n=2 Tax=Promicromonosporaceae TaxID=85017 RepID=A0ABX5EHX6_9MICO|nr:D-amino-acid:oxygen oxidoreductase (deaminating) [Isoptericola sp. CG 20/1183]PRZ10025.1 D-amino-acid:oxygen oxidoreductase (deaminating) [Isoptericola halotolerans]
MVDVTVVGAGVMGLSCAVRLLEAGHRVAVRARELPQDTTSAVAAALWYPYLALPQDRVTAWAARSFDVFAGIADDDPAAGVRMRPGTEVFTGTPTDPWWRDAVPRLDRTADVPPSYAAGWTFTAPLVDMPVYLAWLAGRVETLGGTIVRASLDALPGPGGDDGATVVHCTGLGARGLVGDGTLHPVRGQTVVLEQWGLDRWWLDAVGPTYVVPRGREVVVGGTDGVGAWDRTPSADTAADILERAARLVPEVRSARVLRHAVGLRPARPTVRVERDGHVVHCYGHGGAGVTLSWGCADEVARLVAA